MKPEDVEKITKMVEVIGTHAARDFGSANPQRELDEARVTIRRLTEVIEQAEAHVEDRDQRLYEKGVELVSAKAAAERAEVDRRALVVALTEAQATITRQMEGRRAEVAELEDRVEALRSQRDALADQLAQAKATIVRLSRQESVSGLCEVGYDKVTCIVADEAHRRIYHHGSPIPDYAKQWSRTGPADGAP